MWACLATLTAATNLTATEFFSFVQTVQGNSQSESGYDYQVKELTLTAKSTVIEAFRSDLNEPPTSVMEWHRQSKIEAL